MATTVPSFGPGPSGGAGSSGAMRGARRVGPGTSALTLIAPLADYAETDSFQLTYLARDRDACDAEGMLVWDETHRNGNPGEQTRLVLRDRNHPSVVIWSICNEKLCETNDTLGDGRAAAALYRELDPSFARARSLFARVVAASRSLETTSCGRACGFKPYTV